MAKVWRSHHDEFPEMEFTGTSIECEAVASALQNLVEDYECNDTISIWIDHDTGTG